MMLLSRRGLIAGLVSLVAAPAIVRASSLMPVKAWEPFIPAGLLHDADLRPGAITWVDDVYDGQLAVTRGINGLIPWGTRSFLITNDGPKAPRS